VFPFFSEHICNRTDRKWGRFVTGIRSFFFRCQNGILVDRTDLCKISKLVYGDKENVTCLYSVLQGQRQFMAAIES